MLKTPLAITIVFLSISLNSFSLKKRKPANAQLITNFNPDGYYYINPLVTLENKYAIEWVHIAVKGVQKPIVELRLEVNGKADRWITVMASSYKVEKNDTRICFDLDGLGKLELKGSFTGKYGPFHDKVNPNETIVFKGKLLSENTSIPITMTWWEGD